MKKKIICFVFVFILLLFIINNLFKEKEIRVRIIPNSNDEADLKTKEVVKKYVVEYLNKQISTSFEETFENINSTYKQLENDMNDELGIKTTISFDKHILYNKTYNDTAILNEKCYCLYVVINKGMGDNWWGSVFPKFLATSSDEEVEYKSFLYECYKRMIG